MMRVWFAVLSTLIMTVVILAWTLAAPSQTNGALSVNAKPGEWRYLNADPLSTRYSPLDQINKDNFKNLKIAWRGKPAISTGTFLTRRHGAEEFFAATQRSRSIAARPRRSWRMACCTILAGGQRVVAALMRLPASNCGCGTGWTKTAATARRRGETPAALPLIGRTAGEQRADFRHYHRIYLVALDAKTGVPGESSSARMGRSI